MRFGVNFHEQDLLLAIEHCLRGKENVGSEDAIQLLLVKLVRGAGRTAEIDRHHWLIDEGKGAEPKPVRDGDAVQASVDAQLRRKLGAAWDRRHPEVLAPRGGDRAHRRASIDAEESGFAVYFRSNQKVILPRTLEV